MKLSYDPYKIYRLSKTPAGLYARQKWLGEAETAKWKKDYQETVDSLFSNQLPDGSWNMAAMATINHLFGLHLTVRTSNAQIDSALNWLLAKITFRKEEIDQGTENVANGIDLSGLPFVSGRMDMFLIGAFLFLATIFGRENDPDVLAYYQCLSALGVKNKGQWSDEASSHNIFRAMVVHPIFAKDKATEFAVEYLAAIQTERGQWGKNLAFYQTLNALAHLSSPKAERQLEKAFKWVFENQNNDGTWSKSEPEWNTFLTVHALKNKGLL